MKRTAIAIGLFICMCSLAYPSEADSKHDVKHYLELGQMLEFNANSEAAQRAYTKVLSIDPNSVEAHRGLARVDIQLDQTEQAIKELKASVQLTPQDETAWLELSGVLKKTGRSREAVQLLKSACAAPHDGLKLDRELAFTLLEADQPGQAAEKFRLLIAQQPDVIDDYLGLAIADFRSGNENLAQADIKKVLQLSPNEPNAFCIQADLDLSHGKKDEAIAGYLKALAIRPALSKPYLSLGNLYLEDNQTDRAREIFEKAMANCAPEADLLVGMAVTEERTSSPECAADYYRRAANLETDPARKREIRQHIKDLGPFDKANKVEPTN